MLDTWDNICNNIIILPLEFQHKEQSIPFLQVS